MKAKVEINGKTHEIDLTDEQVRSIENKTWEDEYQELVDNNRTMFNIIELKIFIDYNNCSGSNIYFTRKDNIHAINKNIDLFIRMKQFAYLRNEGWKPDWFNNMQTKWGIGIIDEKVNVFSFRSYNQLIFGIAVKSEEIAKEMLSIFKDDILKYYGK